MTTDHSLQDSGRGNTARHGRRVTRRTLMALAVLAVCNPLLAQVGAASPDAFAPGRVLMLPRAGLPAAALQDMLGKAGAHRSTRIGNTELRIVELPPGLEKQAVERLSRHPHVKFAELDRVAAPAAPTNDPYYGSAWHLPKVKASTAWDSSTGSGVTIAVLDTGVDGSHPDLSARMVPGWNFYNNNSNTSDVHGHGTAVAGSAAATMNNGIGVAAVAGNARIMPVRVADANAYATWSTIAQGITWAADNGARVANISFVGTTDSSTVRNAAQYFKDLGGLVLVAAGNNNRKESFASTTAMIPVVATDSSDLKASFSSWGDFVSISAPGVDVWTTTRGGGYQQWWGTSIATPVTAGVVALMMARNPSLPASQIESLLYSTSVDLGAAGRDAVFGYGRVDAAAAVVAAGNAVSNVDTQAPTVALTSPEPNATVTGVVPVTVATSDNVGVTRVELRVNGTLVATDNSAPFGFSWDSNGTNGIAALTARAYDAAGNQTTSADVAVNVANVTDAQPPQVVISGVTEGATVAGTVNIRVSASDNSGSAGITQRLYIDNKQVATATGSSLSYSWNTKRVRAGQHRIEATARDAAGNTSSQLVTVIR
jgi:thermitase